MLEIGDDLRHGWMGHTKMLGSLGQATRMHDREKHAQVPQPQPAPNMVVPIGYLCHKHALSSMKQNRDYWL
jgi:hypothetical protein